MSERGRRTPSVTGENLATGTGYETIRWALDPSRGMLVIGALAAFAYVQSRGSAPLFGKPLLTE